MAHRESSEQIWPMYRILYDENEDLGHNGDNTQVQRSRIGMLRDLE